MEHLKGCGVFEGSCPGVILEINRMTYSFSPKKFRKAAFLDHCPNFLKDCLIKAFRDPIIFGSVVDCEVTNSAR